MAIATAPMTSFQRQVLYDLLECMLPDFRCWPALTRYHTVDMLCEARPINSALKVDCLLCGRGGSGACRCS